MPRILLSAAHIVPVVLDALGTESYAPDLVAPYPPLPGPFHATAERVERLQGTRVEELAEDFRRGCEESAGKGFCSEWRSREEVGE